MGSLCGPRAITGDHDSKGFPSFVYFDLLQRNTVAKVILHSDIARSISNRTVFLGAMLPLEIDQVPVAFGRDEGAARGAKAALLVIESASCISGIRSEPL